MDDSFPEDNTIRKAGEVSDFMWDLMGKYPLEWSAVRPECIPFGDLAYGMALEHWIENGKHPEALFSYAEGELSCPYLIRFRKEITEKFGLPVLTKQEAQEWKQAHSSTCFISERVYDWGSGIP